MHPYIRLHDVDLDIARARPLSASLEPAHFSSSLPVPPFPAPRLLRLEKEYDQEAGRPVSELFEHAEVRGHIDVSFSQIDSNLRACLLDQLKNSLRATAESSYTYVVGTSINKTDSRGFLQKKTFVQEPRINLTMRTQRTRTHITHHQYHCPSTNLCARVHTRVVH